jgi:hypothetical protein
MSNLIKGRDLNLYYVINGFNYPAAHATNCKIQFSADTQETTTKNTQRGKTYEYSGKNGYTLSLDGLTNLIDVANIAVFQTALMTSQKLNFIFTDVSNVQWMGTVLVTGLDIDSMFNAMSNYTHNMLGDGDIVPIYYDVPNPPVGAVVNIIDQFGDIIAMVTAPGSYSVVVFDAIDEGDAFTVDSDYQLIIAEG